MSEVADKLPRATGTAPCGARMTTAEAAAYLGITAGALRNMVRRRQIVHHRLSPRGQCFFYTRELDAFVESTRVDVRHQSTTPARSTPYGRDISHLLTGARVFE